MTLSSSSFYFPFSKNCFLKLFPRLRDYSTFPSFLSPVSLMKSIVQTTQHQQEIYVALFLLHVILYACNIPLLQKGIRFKLLLCSATLSLVRIMIANSGTQSYEHFRRKYTFRIEASRTKQLSPDSDSIFFYAVKKTMLDFLSIFLPSPYHHYH